MGHMIADGNGGPDKILVEGPPGKSGTPGKPGKKVAFYIFSVF